MEREREIIKSRKTDNPRVMGASLKGEAGRRYTLHKHTHQVLRGSDLTVWANCVTGFSMEMKLIVMVILIAFRGDLRFAIGSHIKIMQMEHNKL